MNFFGLFSKKPTQVVPPQPLQIEQIPIVALEEFREELRRAEAILGKARVQADAIGTAATKKLAKTMNLVDGDQIDAVRGLVGRMTPKT